MKIFKFGAVGRIRIKGEESAPKEWKRSIWDKIKNNDLFSPINIHDENNIREIKIFYNKKVFIIGINLFLVSFAYSFIKDVNSIFQARQNIININKIDFNKEIPSSVTSDYIKLKQEFNATKSQKLKSIIIDKENTINAFTTYLKERHWQQNTQLLKSNIIPLCNDLLILLMISKYYWKRKKS